MSGVGKGETDQAAGAITCDFVPIFDHRQGKFDTLYCFPKMTKTDGSAAADDVLLGEGGGGRVANEKLLIRNMEGTLQAGLHKAKQMAASGDNTKIVIPVNGPALLIKAVAVEFSNICRPLDDAVRQAVIFEATNVVDAKRMSVLDDIAIVLFPFCLTYGIRVLPSMRDFSVCATCNYSGVALDLKNRPWPVKDVSAFLVNFAKATEANRLKAYVHGIATPELMAAAVEAGIRFIDGAAVKGPDR